MVYIFLLILGSIFGSFLNVCIHRMPKGESIINPGSHCPKCGHMLSWQENVPLLSFIILKGRCRNCKDKISYIYPIVETLTALLAVTVYIFFGISLKSLIYFAVFSSLIVASFVDFHRLEIPDIITLPGIFIGLALSFLYPALLSKTKPLDSFLDSFLGMFVGGASLYLLGFLGEMVFKKEAMGGGDIKLLAMIGAFLGWKSVLLTFFIAPFFGSVTGLILKIKEGKEVIPYGPYLSLAAFVSVLWGEKIIRVLFGV